MVYVAQRFHGFERDDEVDLTLGNEVRGDGVGADAQARHHIAATLAHSVYFGLLEIHVESQSCIADDCSYREDTLTPDSG